MKIFVTVGTTKFDTLIENIDKNLNATDYEIILQIADGEYKPKNFEYFDFTKDIKNYFENSDIIITHAGAGSIYELLELKKKILIVPNLDRVDKHQSDIADFMDKNNYAKKLKNYKELDKVLKDISSTSFKQFTKDSFFKVDEIIEFINKK